MTPPVALPTPQRRSRFEPRLRRAAVSTLQINVGKLCNQACHHCHVEAGPKRTEILQRDVAKRLVELVAADESVRTIDITGGAPELNPSFRWLVTRMRKLGRDVIDRCNLTVLFERGMSELAVFLAAKRVHVIASLPCYTADNVDDQRGRGVFDKSIKALRTLNRLGYGRDGTGLELDLVYNPGGAHLPPVQDDLERRYKTELSDHFDIVFNRLLTLTNLPIKRFAHDLARQGKSEDYMQLLIDNFNPAAVDGVMCRSLVSVGYDGQLYDCDFNQMLELPAANRRQTVWDIRSLSELVDREIATDDHCFGCTAGAGSSCGGALT
jgi:radical SAM/Cys-rich protein